MRGQATMEYLIVLVVTLATYAIVMPAALSSFQNSYALFLNTSVHSIANQIGYKVNELNLMPAGTRLSMRLHSPVQFNLTFANEEITGPFNEAINAPGLIEGGLFVEKGENDLAFEKTDAGVAVHLK